MLAKVGRTAPSDPVDIDLGDLTATVVPLRSRLTETSLLVTLFDPGELQRRTVDDRALLTSFADHAALALDRAQAVSDREELAVISDRERIARDLHDVVIQRLFAIGMQLQAASLRTTDDVRERLEQASSTSTARSATYAPRSSSCRPRSGSLLPTSDARGN